MTQVPAGSVSNSRARFVPQAAGVVADIAAVSALIAGGGKAVVLAASFGAVLLGTYVIWKRWGGYVDRALVAGIVVAVAGSGVFGYSLAEPRSGPGLLSPASPGESPSTTPRANVPLTIVPNQPTTTSPLSTTSQASTTSAPSVPGTTWLVDLQSVAKDSNKKWTTKVVQVKSITYSKALISSGSWCSPIELDFVISGKYSRFTAMVGIADDSEETGPLNFFVLADQARVKAITEVGLAAPQAIDIPVAGVTRLTIGIESPPRSSTSCPGPEVVGVWIDPALTSAGA